MHILIRLAPHPPSQLIFAGALAIAVGLWRLIWPATFWRRIEASTSSGKGQANVR